MKFAHWQDAYAAGFRDGFHEQPPGFPSNYQNTYENGYILGCIERRYRRRALAIQRAYWGRPKGEGVVPFRTEFLSP